MKETTKKLYNAISLQHKLILQLLQEQVDSDVKEWKVEELLDNSFAFREALKLLEHLEKEIRKAKKKNDAKCGVLCMSENHYGPLHSAYVTGKIIQKPLPDIPSPRKDPEGYLKFMEFFGVAPEHAELFRVHWDSIVAFHGKRMEEGLPAIPGLDVAKTTPTYELQLRKKHDIEFD